MEDIAMNSRTITGSASAVELYHRLKMVPHEKMRSEGRAAMVRLSEQQAHAEKRHLAERARRLGRFAIQPLEQTRPVATVVLDHFLSAGLADPP
jgi:hypothetical protein